MNDEFADKEYRDAFVEANLRNGIAFQIRAIRKRQGLSQHDLGDRMGTPQNVVSRLEDPGYGKLTLQTLLAVAKALDVGLTVRFVSFSQLADSLADVSDDALAVPGFEEEAAERLVNQTPSLIDEFTAPSFYNPTTASDEFASLPVCQSNIIDAGSMFSRNQRAVGTSFTTGEKMSGALATFDQEGRARAV